MVSLTNQKVCRTNAPNKGVIGNQFCCTNKRYSNVGCLFFKSDGRFTPENGLCRTKYADEPRFRGFCISSRLPRQHKLSNSWRNVCQNISWRANRKQKYFCNRENT